MRKRIQQYGQRLKGRSIISNGRKLLPTVDRRSPWSRRFHDLVSSFGSDLALDLEHASEGQKALVRRCSALCTELEILEVRFAHNNGAKVEELETYQRATNSLRRTIQTLGIHRGRLAKEINTPTLIEYLRRRGDDDDEPLEAAE
jgi:hypothetical protein